MSETETKLCTKKDGSASNKKNSFKINWPLNLKRNTFYLACDKISETNDWVNLLNQVTNLNKTEAPIKSIIKQQKSATLIVGPAEITTPMAYKQDKANSAPSSPLYNRNQKHLQNLNSNKNGSTTIISYDNKSLNEQNYYIPQANKIRPSYQSQPNLSDSNNNNIIINKDNYQGIYEAFEKPVQDTHFQLEQQHQNYYPYNSKPNPLLKAAHTIDSNLSSYNKNFIKSDQNLSGRSNYPLTPPKQDNNNYEQHFISKQEW